MKKDTIVQFVGFITRLDFDEFVTKWEHYAKQFMADPEEMILQQGSGTSRYKYLSQQECPEDDFRFAFMKGRNSEHFAEHKVKVAQTGGYIPMQVQCKHAQKGDVKVIAFVSHNENDISFYSRLSLYRHLNIYQAYYESCAYAYILEYFTPEKDVAELLQQLKTKIGTEAALYKECLVPKV